MTKKNKTKEQLMKEIEKLHQKIKELEKAEEALKENEELYSSVVENSNDAIIIHHDGIIKFVNSAVSQFIDIPKKEFIGKNITDFVHPDDREIILERFKQRKARKKVESLYEISLVKKDDSILPAEINVSLIHYQGKPAGLVFIRNITERKKIEKELKESEARFRRSINQAPFPIMIHAEDGEIVLINDIWSEITGYQKEDIPTIEEWTKKAYGKKKDVAKRDIDRLYDKKKSVKEGEYRIKTKKGQVRIWEFSSTPLGKMSDSRRLVLGMAHDITERKKAEQQLRKSLEEKEVLLKEIHHRVKNNMQVISSLINIQARRIKDSKAREMFKATRNRIMSMVLAHERLYRSEDLTGIDFSKYIEQMAVHMMSYDIDSSKNIQLKRDVEKIFLDVTKAIPLGLITNELLTNSLKHAFTNKKQGEIKVKFYKKSNTYHLSISDNGKGFPKDFDFRTAESMGLDLVNSLVKQINGNIELHRDKGTFFKITFKD